MKPRALILRTAGTNCDAEAAYAFELAGAEPTLLHINRLLERRSVLGDYQILALPGGFSYGDDIAAGKILANQIRHHLGDTLRDFVAEGKPIIGICNGFQVLVKTDLLPGPLGEHGQSCTLANNTCGRFIDRWVWLKETAGNCIWTAGVGLIELPIAHGEGRFVPANETVRKKLWDSGHVALQYAKSSGELASGVEPFNPNGSVDDIAGVCDATGLVFGLMPHPERYVTATQYFAWTRRTIQPQEGQGLQIFRNAVHHVASSVRVG